MEGDFMIKNKKISKIDEKEYVEHVKECLSFAQRTAESTLGQENKEMIRELMWAVFDKVCTPIYYFLQNSKNGETSPQPPTEKQITYAQKLGIQEPEKFSREELSQNIDNALKMKKK
jgi:hypothetical protein